MVGFGPQRRRPRKSLEREGIEGHDAARLANHEGRLRDPRAGREADQSASILVGSRGASGDSASDRDAGVSVKPVRDAQIQRADADPAASDSDRAEGNGYDRHREDGQRQDVRVRGPHAAVRDPIARRNASAEQGAGPAGGGDGAYARAGEADPRRRGETGAVLRR